MFEERFSAMTDFEKNSFRRIVNQLLAHTFLVNRIHDFRADVIKSNPDYNFVERRFSLFEDYLSFAGFSLERAGDIGVIRLYSNSCDETRVHFDKLTTEMIYVIRSIYEKRMLDLSLNSEVYVSIGEVIHEMLDMNMIQKRPAKNLLVDAVSALIRYRIVEKVSGKLDDGETRLLVLPTILYVVTNDDLAIITEMIEKGTFETVEEDDVCEGEETENEET